MGVSSSSDHIYIEGHSSDRKESAPQVRYNAVGVHYFETMRVPLLRGRTFTEQDNDQAPRVAVVNEAMAHKFWPSEDAIGKRFSVEGPGGPFMEIVGLTKQGKYTGPAEDPTPFFYVPMEQGNELIGTIQLRTASDPEAMGPELVRQIHALAPTLPIVDLQSMDSVLQGVNGLFLFRMATRFSGALGMVGLMLAMVGVYGVISYAAALRTHEIGVRMALGADRGSILKMVLRQGFVLIGIGVAAGLVFAVLAGMAIKVMLVNVSPADPLTLGASAVFLCAVGLLASFVPARRAMNIEPLKALRQD
jgi:putative ABC transport system permease protein